MEKRNNANETISNETVMDISEKAHEKAQELLENHDKMERFLQKLEKKLETVPVAGTALAYIPLMVSLLRSYIKKEYPDVPVGTIISILVALIYFVSPIDIIPDVLPAGYTDDGLVILGCLALTKTDLEDYRIWRKTNGYEVQDLPNYDEISAQTAEKHPIISAYFLGKKAGNKNK